MAKKPKPPSPPPNPEIAAGGVRKTRFVMYAFIASLKDCGHEASHVRQVLRELLDGGPHEHTTTADCWCEPEVEYVDPETGAAVYLHRVPQ
jgi:hypothetical protein